MPDTLTSKSQLQVGLLLHARPYRGMLLSGAMLVQCKQEQSQIGFKDMC